MRTAIFVGACIIVSAIDSNYFNDDTFKVFIILSFVFLAWDIIIDLRNNK